MKKNNLHGWVFTYNQYTDRYYGAKRENYMKLFSDVKSPDVVGATSMKVLEELIIRTDGDTIKIAKLVKKG